MALTSSRLRSEARRGSLVPRAGPIRLLTLDRPATVAVAAAIATSVLGLLCTIGWLLALSIVIDRVFLRGDDVAAVGWPLALMAGLLVLRGFLTWAGEVLAERSSARLRTSVRADLVTHIFSVGPAGMAREQVGEVSTTLGEGVEALREYVTRFVPAAALGLIGPALVFAAIAILDPWTTLILLFAGPMLILLLAVIGGRTRELTQRRFDELGWLSAFYLDMIRGLATLKAFGRSRDGATTIEGVSSRFGSTTMEVLRTAFQTSLVMEWAATAATALVAVEVSFRLIVDDVSFGTALAVLLLTPEFFVPFRRLSLEYHSGQAGNAAMQRIDRLLALPTTSEQRVRQPARSDPATPAATTTLTATAGLLDHSAPTVEFVDVGYTYPGADVPSLRGLDLVLERERTLALVGPSGAGKTTVTRLLLRFIEPTSGRVLVDGHPLADMDASTWRRLVAWVPQHPTILAGTVADNIRLGDPDASDQRVWRAAEVAQATEFIAALPQGIDTPLGEHGLQLSGGQRQRLAIARAALRDAPLVVLDEYTAYLDHQTETDVLSAITALLQGRTALLIAHRERTAARADARATLVAGSIAPASLLPPTEPA